ncbi:MAG: 3-oxoacyl-[acyl-carrier-protein] reductase [Thermoanaerobacteraceae bacterium]|nr:3-oxoacyl-[acyl-carrier-protein] reductase [Thermoanaerobacteraceae bacterium]
MLLEGKVAIITGGSRGIGKATAIKLANLGAKIIVNYTNRLEAANEVVNIIKDNNGEAITVKADVSNISEVKDMMKFAVDTYGSIDILVNNAGVTKDTLILRMNEEDWDKVINTNLKGAFNCIKEASRYMIKNKYGKIVNVSSVIGVIGNIGQANYAASKAGIIGLTKSAAKEFASRGINVNAVAPGFIDTEMTQVLKDEIRNEMLKAIPLGRFGTPEDVSDVIAFLVLPYSDYITGQVIHIDGGMVM